MTISLTHGQSTTVAFATPAETDPILPLYIVSRSANLARARVAKDGRIEGYINDAREVTVLLSNNTELTIPALEAGDNPAPLPSVTLGPWRLSVESYAAPANLSTASVVGNTTTVTVSSPLQSLVPWTQIRGLERVSGVGTYRTSFGAPPQLQNGTQTSYTIHFTGRVLNTIRVFVNGVPVPAIDPLAPSEGRDITNLLKGGGENGVVIEVSSTLFNAVKARMGELKSVGLGVHVPKYYTQVQWADYGLIGDVVIKTWRKAVLS